jgi:AcrR family transcriptional regulator
MPKAKPLNENAKIAAVALRVAASQGWESVTLDKIAKAAHISVATLKARFKSTTNLVPVLAEEIDREAFASTGTAGAVHDRLFDLLMARFDVLQKHRQAIQSMAKAARHDRALSLALSRATLDGVYRLIEAAQIKDKTPSRPVMAVGLAAIYGWAFCVWMRDNSRDMAKTMAALDRGLRWSGKAVAFLTPRS